MRYIGEELIRKNSSLRKFLHVQTFFDHDFATENENYYLDMTEKKFQETWNACLALLRVKADLDKLDSEE